MEQELSKLCAATDKSDKPKEVAIEISTWHVLFVSIGKEQQLILNVAMVVLQQLTGINVILFFSNEMFLARGPDAAKIGSVVIGIAQFIFGFIATFGIDRTI